MWRRQAKLQVAQTDIKQAETMLSYTLLTVLSMGTSLAVALMQALCTTRGASNAQPLMTITDVTKVRVFVRVPEADQHGSTQVFKIRQRRSGDNRTRRCKSIDARITRTSLKLDSQSRTLLTEIDIDNSDLKLLPERT